MTAIAHLLLFLASAAVMWLLTGLVLEAVDRVARRWRQSGFIVALFVLGFLTSIGELSVMANSTVRGVPGVSAGNLVGASIVLLLGLIPTLGVLGDGIQLSNALTRTQLALALFVIALPALCLSDGGTSRGEGVLCVLAYGALLYRIRGRAGTTTDAADVVEEVAEEVGEVVGDVAAAVAAERPDLGRGPVVDAVVIAGGALLILLAGNVLVRETLYFAALLNVRGSVIGLLVLSLGTNTPELVMAVRSVQKGRKDIAFGHYVGSALTNTLLFGFLGLLNGTFAVDQREFVINGLMMVVGLTVFYAFAVSGNRISRREGMVLALLYGAFVLFQLANMTDVGAGP